MLALCPCWESDGGRGQDYKDAGTSRHSALRALLENSPMPDGILDDDKDSAQWAADYIRLKSPTADFPLRCEHHVNPLDDQFEPLFENGGTLDASCGNQLFDLKSRERDYGAQMAAYALAIFQEYDFEFVEVHLLFTETRKIQVFKITEAEAVAVVNKITANVLNPQKQPTPCDYCGWCSRRVTCPALTSVARKVAAGYSDLESVKSWHPSQMETGADLAVALNVWRTILKKWGESLEYHALEAATKKGITIPGFELATKSGKTYVTDVPSAFKLAGLPQEEFLRGCQVRLVSSKTYKDQIGLIDIFKKFNGVEKSATAKRDLLKKLEPVVKKTKDSTYLKAVKGEEEESE